MQRRAFARAALVSAVAVSASLAGCGRSVPPEVTAALEALRKLAARTQVGVSFRDYQSELGSAAYAVNRMPPMEKNAAAAIQRHIIEAASLYVLASEVWSETLKGRESNQFKVLGYGGSVTGAAETLLKKFPNLEVRDDYTGGKYVYNDSALSAIWGKAREELDAAEVLLKK